MTDQSKTKAQLINELAEMRQRIAELEKSETEHTKAEIALKESEELYRTLIETSPDPILMYSISGEIVAANLQAAKIYGVSNVAELLREVKTVFDLLTTDGKAMAAANFRRTLTEGHSQKNEYLVRIHDGTLIPMEINSSVVWAATGEPRAFISVIRDITDRKRADETLQATSQRFYTILSSIYTGILLVTEGGQVDFANQAFCSLYHLKESPADLRGLTTSEMIEKIKNAYLHPDAAVAHIGEIVKRGQPVMSEEVAMQGGRTFLRDFIPIHVNGKLYGRLWHHQDITDLKRAEEALINQLQFLQVLIDTIPIPVFFKDTKGIYLGCNKACETFFGPRDALLGKTVYDVAPKDIADIYYRADCELFKNPGIQIYETLAADKTGARHHVVFNKATYQDKNGHVVGLIGAIFDITDRKRAEEALQLAEFSIENSGVTTIWFDRHSNVVRVNEATCQSLGYSREELLHMTVRDFDPDFQSADKWEKSWEDLKERRRHGTMKTRHRRKDGRIFPVEVMSSFFAHAGKEYIFSVIHDITERTQADEALRISEEKYRNIYENAVEGIFQSTPEGRFLSVNPAMAEMCGYASPQEMVASITDIGSQFYVYPEERKIFMKNLEEQGVDEKFEHQVYRKDGSTIWISTNSRVVRDDAGHILYYEGTHEDITKRKRVEAQLQESEEKYRLVVENAREAIVVTQDAKLVFANRAAVDVTGYSEETFASRPFAEFIYPDDRNRVVENHIRRLQGEDVPRIYSYRVVSRDGSIKWAETNSIVVQWKGKPAVLNFINDITERKAAEDALKRTEEERRMLEDRLRRSEKMEALGTLAGGVAHDLNNVLGVLVGYSELLLEKIPEESSLRRYANNIFQSSQRGAAIIQDLLTLARRGVLISEVVDLNRVVSDYLRMPEFETLTSYHPGVKILTDLEDGLLNIKGSPIHLGKTVMNLVSNATEAISGQGEVTIRTENRYLDQRIRGYDYINEGDYAVLTVSDTGKGIARADIGKIFEPFYTKKVMGRSGTGLGLAVVWGTVKDHDGFIDVQSEEEKGSTFTLYFPVTREEPAKAQASPLIETYMGRGESILVVDDVKEQRELAVSMLTRLCYQVDAVSSGELALSYLAAKQADLLVLDMIMYPGMDGLDTYRKVLNINPRQRAVIVSGFSESERVSDAKALGAGAYVRKPYILEKLGLAVREELDRE